MRGLLRGRIGGMQAHELFGVVVRTLGLWITLYGVWNLAFGVGRLTRAISSSRHPTINYLLAGVLYLVVGALLIFGADAIVGVSYHLEK
jgi:hypothetical protein